MLRLYKLNKTNIIAMSLPDNDLNNPNIKYSELKNKIQDTFLISKEQKNLILEKINSWFFSNEIAEKLTNFFIEWQKIEEETITLINEEFPIITRQMLTYIEEKTKEEDILHIENLTNNILLA